MLGSIGNEAFAGSMVFGARWEKKGNIVYKGINIEMKIKKKRKDQRQVSSGKKKERKTMISFVPCPFFFSFLERKNGKIL